MDREVWALLFAAEWTIGAFGMALLAAGLVNSWFRTEESVWVDLALVGLAWAIAAAAIAVAPWLEERDPATLTLLCFPMAAATVRGAWLIWTTRDDARDIEPPGRG
ncbi:MAG: hypothetical protein GY812_16680 [Actinomycetia bacterium]|nr:hypothetical protein [Actinomycetes bacterium]